MASDDRVVLVGPWRADGSLRARPVTLHASWFASHYTVDRRELERAEVWEDARLLIEGRMRHQIEKLMKDTGFVPVGDVVVEQLEDLMLNRTEFRMKQRGMESADPIWISIRDALAEDRADRAALRQHREDVGPTDETP